MITKENFVFTMGYKGDTAIVDGDLKARYLKSNALELAENGLFKPAICSALYSGDEKAMEEILTLYNTKVAVPLESRESLMKTFGVTYLPEEISKVEII